MTGGLCVAGAEDTAACFLVEPIPALAAQLTTVLQETGAALAASSHTSLGALILTTLEDPALRTASALMNAVIRIIPAFADVTSQATLPSCL